MLPTVIKKFLSSLSAKHMRAIEDYNRAIRDISPEQEQEVAGLIERLQRDEADSPLATYNDEPDDTDSFRAYDRIDCKFQATFVRNTPPHHLEENIKGALDGRVCNVSQGGMSMITTFEMFPGEVLTALLKSGKYVEKRIYAEVRRCERLVRIEKTYKVGLMFITQQELIAAERTYHAQPVN